MTTWAKNSSEFLAFLNGLDSRDAFSKSQRFPLVRLPNANVEIEKPPLEAQNDVLALVYEILGVLRKGGKKRPSARNLLNVPQVDEFFSKATQAMVEAVSSVDSPLQKAIEGLVTEAYIERIRSEFVGELARSLKVFRARLAKDRAKYDNWHELDGGVVLYDVFRPNLWDIYRELWNKWQADMVSIHKSGYTRTVHRQNVKRRGDRLLKKTVLFAFGAVFPLVALAVLTIVMPPIGTWAIVTGLAVVAGVLSAQAGQELVQLLLSIREGLGEANKEAKAVQSEANKILAEQFERFFEEYGQRDEDWRTKTLAEWQAVRQSLDSSFEKMLSDVRSHLATLAEQERAWQKEAVQSRAEAMQAEAKQARSEFAQLCEVMKETVEQHAAVVQMTQKTIENVEDHFAKQQANALTEWQAVTQALASSFEKNLAALAEQERVWQEEAVQSRAEAIDAELAQVKETFALIENTRNKLNAEFEKAIEELRALTEKQKRDDRDHLEKMLEVQQKAHHEAGERSGQLWCHLLDQLKS